MTEKEEKIFLVNYEVMSSVLASYCSINWMQNLFSKYFAWKVNKKYERLKWQRTVSRFMDTMDTIKHNPSNG